MKRWPNTATLTYQSSGTYNTLGYYVAGTTNTLGIICNIQTNSNKYTPGPDGNNIVYSYDIYAPKGTTLTASAYRLRFFGKEAIVLNPDTFQTQKGWQIKC